MSNRCRRSIKSVNRESKQSKLLSLGLKLQEYTGSGKLRGKVALITGADSGIGKATAIAFAKEGADVAVVYLNEHQDAERTKQEVEQEGQRCLTIAGDVGEEKSPRMRLRRQSLS